MNERDKRTAPRVPVDLEGLISPNGWLKKEVKIGNISESGVLIKTQIPLFSLSKVFVKLNLDGKDFEGQAICVRVSSKPPWEAGLQFVDVDEENRKILAEFLKKRLVSVEEQN